MPGYDNHDNKGFGTIETYHQDADINWPPVADDGFANEDIDVIRKSLREKYLLKEFGISSEGLDNGKLKRINND